MELKLATLTDFERIAAFYKYVIANTPDMPIHARWIYGQHPTDEMITKYIDTGAIYLLEDYGEIAAAMALTMFQDPLYHNIKWSQSLEDTQAAVIHILCVDPAKSRRHIGKRMLTEAVRLAKESGKRAIRLDALASNIPAIKMYENFGFQLKGKMNLYCENAGFTDFLFFDLDL